MKCHTLLECSNALHILFQFIIAGSFGMAAGKYKNGCLVRILSLASHSVL